MATVALSAHRGQIERIKPPRALHCDFPLGRPLGKPNDAAYQRAVLDAAFELLGAEHGPILSEYPDAIEDASSQPLACTIPPRHNPDLPEAVDEALALRPAYERNKANTGRTSVGLAVDADGIGGALEGFIAVASGTPWKEANLPGHPLQLSKDILAYYEEAAAALAEHVPEARSAETWFFKNTAAGKVTLEARQTLHTAKESFWFYLIPFTQGLSG